MYISLDIKLPYDILVGIEKCIQALANPPGLFLFCRIPMNKCSAFYPIAGSRTAWLPCVRKAQLGSRFCRRHGDAVLGAMLGALAYAEPQNVMEHLCGEQRPCAVARAARR